MDNEYHSQLLLSFRRVRLTGAPAYTLKWIDWEVRASVRTKLVRLSWKTRNKHSKFIFLQAAVSAWNQLNVGTEIAETEMNEKNNNL